MANIDGESLSEFMSKPLVLPFLALAALVVGVLAVATLIDRMNVDEQSDERRALIARGVELSRTALVPGSALSCLDARAGEAVENACEKAVFADARSTAAAVAYMAARVDLLRDAATFAKTSQSDVLAEFSATRRAIELDRFGIAAHVLASRDGCTADNCAVFSVLTDTNALKSNLKAQVFDQYVARHAPEWNAAAKTPPAVSETPAVAVEASTTASVPPHAPVSDKYDFPSADSIPPVSIMNAEPPLPADGDKDAGASAQTAGSGPAAGPPTPRSKPAQAQTSPAPTR